MPQSNNNERIVTKIDTSVITSASLPRMANGKNYTSSYKRGERGSRAKVDPKVDPKDPKGSVTGPGSTPRPRNAPSEVMRVVRVRAVCLRGKSPKCRSEKTDTGALESERNARARRKLTPLIT